MKVIKGDGSSGPVDMGTLLNQQAHQQQNAGDLADRIRQLITPNAKQTRIKDVDTYPDGTIRISEFRAEFADGTAVTAPSIVIEPA